MRAGPMFWPVNVVDAGVNGLKELWAADASLASFICMVRVLIGILCTTDP